MTAHRAPVPLAALVVGGFLPIQGGAQQPTAAASAVATPALVFDHVTVVDVEHGALVPARRVVIIGNRIQAVGDTGVVRLPKQATVVDARGWYLIPGLWDMHFHSYETPPPRHYPLLLANGITGIRDPAPFYPLDSLRRWRAEVLAGARIGPPRQILTGAFLDDADSKTSTGLQYGLRVTTPAEARHVIDSLQQAGAEFIKTRGAPSRETFFAMVAEARRRGISLQGHLMPLTPVTLTEASDSGMRIIDHLWNLPDQLRGVCAGDSATLAKCAALAARLRRNSTWIQLGPLGAEFPIRSRLPYLDDSLRQPGNPAVCGGFTICSALPLMARAGMPLLDGSDAPLVDREQLPLPRYLIPEEVLNTAQFGLTPLEALRMVTLNPAQYLRGTDSLGTVAPGKLADLVLLDADPLADLTNITAIRAVVANGRYFDRAALDALLATVRADGTAHP